MLLCWSLAAYIIVRERMFRFWWDRSLLDPAGNPLITSRGMDRLLMPLVLLGHYVQQLICPWHLSPDYSGREIGSVVHFNDPFFYLGIASVVAWFGLTAYAIRKRAVVMLFCLLAGAVLYGMIGNIISLIGTNFAERLMYLPSVFFVILVAMGLSRLPRAASIAVVSILITLGSIQSIAYASRWNDRLTLYQATLTEHPNAIRLYLLLAFEHSQRGEGSAAVNVIEQAQAKMPDYPDVWTRGADVAIADGQLDLAERFLERAEAIRFSLETITLRGQLSKARAATSRPAP